jgi:hypothetical protein
MANKILDDLTTSVTKIEGAADSAIAFIQGVPALIQAAVDKAIGLGATEAQLAPFAQLSTDLNAKADAIGAAIAANP